MRIHPEFEFYKGGKAELEIVLPKPIYLNGIAYAVFAQDYKPIHTAKYIQIGSTAVKIDRICLSLSDTDTDKFEVGDVTMQIHYGDDADITRYLPEVYGRCLRTYKDTATT